MTAYANRFRVHRAEFAALRSRADWQAVCRTELRRRYPPTPAKATWLGLVEAGDLAALERAVMSSDTLRRVRPVI
ncbi:hypothetical protein [Tsukamurella soli]